MTLGDVISIYADGAGFISTLGLVDDRCVTNFNDGNLQVPPIKYRDCLFRICPQCRYAARRQFWRSVKPGQSRLVEAFVQKLSEAADVEKEQNEKEKLKQHGQEVRYGQLIQLLHVKSNKYLTGMVTRIYYALGQIRMQLESFPTFFVYVENLSTFQIYILRYKIIFS